MHYEGNIFRPPSEADSCILQVTIGCSHNSCTFCAMYADKSFRIRDLVAVKEDIDSLTRYADRIHRVFLSDGDALILPQGHLVEILTHIKKRLPKVRRVSTYGDAFAILRKTSEELRELAHLGLSLVYEGVESGSDLVLTRIGKRSSIKQMIEGANQLKKAGIRHSIMFLLGLGGTELSEESARLSGLLLTQMNPDFAAVLTLTLVAGTPLSNQASVGKFLLPSEFDLLKELRVLLENANPDKCLFSANHASNYLPIQGWLPKDRATLLAAIDAVIASADRELLTPEWLRGL